MDNFHIDVVSRHREMFNLAMQLAFCGEGFKPHIATHYLIHPEKGFCLFWEKPTKAETKEVQVLPYGMNYTQAAELIWGWLIDPQTPLVKKCPSGGDVDNLRGWRVYNEDWGHILGDSYGIVAVQAHAAWSGK